MSAVDVPLVEPVHDGSGLVNEEQVVDSFHDVLLRVGSGEVEAFRTLARTLFLHGWRYAYHAGYNDGYDCGWQSAMEDWDD